MWDAVYLYELDGQHFIKRLQTVKNKLLIISDNKLYETWEASEEIKNQMNIIGLVTAYLQIHRIGWGVIMTFIKDLAAYKAALLYMANGQEVIAHLYLKKAYGYSSWETWLNATEKEFLMQR